MFIILGNNVQESEPRGDGQCVVWCGVDAGVMLSRLAGGGGG